MHSSFKQMGNGRLISDFGATPTPPNQLRWNPLPIPAEPTDFIQGLVTYAGNGDAHAQSGCGIHLYAANRSMTSRAFYNADGEMLILPQQGHLRFVTELGVIEVEPQEIVVIPRGIRFRVELMDEIARGYICENFAAPFRLPDRGPIGANGLANPRTAFRVRHTRRKQHRLRDLPATCARDAGHLPPAVVSSQHRE